LFMFQNKVLKLIGLYFIWSLIVSCGVPKKEENKKVLIETSEGEVTVVLYNSTPKHRDNFIKLVEGKFYEGVLFHRVIKDFMVQTGDPESKNAAPNIQLGNGGPGYTIEAEIIDSLFHKKGALCAARQGDQVNPEKRSSGSQFYIATGKVYSKDELKRMEAQMNIGKENTLLQQFIQAPENQSYATRLQEAQELGQNPEKREEAQGLINALVEEIKPLAIKESDKVSFSTAQIEAYSTIGGVPHLDGAYTVFGEVVSGMEVAEKIGLVPADGANRPLTDVKILSMKILN